MSKYNFISGCLSYMGLGRQKNCNQFMWCNWHELFWITLDKSQSQILDPLEQNGTWNLTGSEWYAFIEILISQDRFADITGAVIANWLKQVSSYVKFRSYLAVILSGASHNITIR